MPYGEFNMQKPENMPTIVFEWLKNLSDTEAKSCWQYFDGQGSNDMVNIIFSYHPSLLDPEFIKPIRVK